MNDEMQGTQAAMAANHDRPVVTHGMAEIEPGVRIHYVVAGDGPRAISASPTSRKYGTCAKMRESPWRSMIGAIVFFDLQNGVKLALWPRKSIAHDTHLPVQAPSATDFTLAQNVSSKEEVDLVMQQAKAAGATIIKTAQETFYGGYAGYFQDPGSACLEIAWKPDLLPD